MDSIFDAFKHLDLPQDVANKHGKQLTFKQVKKGTVLQVKGETNLKGFIVKKGLLRCYALDEKGKEHIFMFAPEGWAVGDMESQAFNKPTELYIDALEDSDIFMASYNTHEEFLEEQSSENYSKEFNRLIRRIGVLQRRVIMLLSFTAAERYQEFLKTYPQIVQRVPQKMIASYLGITPEALSKIRREITKG